MSEKKIIINTEERLKERAWIIEESKKTNTCLDSKKVYHNDQCPVWSLFDRLHKNK